MKSNQEESTDSQRIWVTLASGLTCQRILLAEDTTTRRARTLGAQPQRIPESWVVQVTKVQVR